MIIRMVNMNEMKRALRKAEKYQDNPTVMALVEKLNTQISTEKLLRDPMFSGNPLEGYRHGIDGKEGYSPFMVTIPDPTNYLKAASHVLLIGNTLECLLCVLNALGEDITY